MGLEVAGRTMGAAVQGAAVTAAPCSAPKPVRSCNDGQKAAMLVAIHLALGLALAEQWSEVARALEGVGLLTPLRRQVLERAAAAARDVEDSDPAQNVYIAGAAELKYRSLRALAMGASVAMSSRCSSGESLATCSQGTVKA